MSTAEQGLHNDNQVFLRGRLADKPVLRELPSGDVLATFRLTVARPRGERVRVDSVECATVKPRARTTLERAEPGDEVEVRGQLHRRFWRTSAGPASRYSVDTAAVKITRSGRRGAASPARMRASA